MTGNATGRYRPYTLDELEQLPALRWLVDEVLVAESLAVLYGAPGVGKTFAALDVGLCLATGADWHGHAVTQARVVYIAGEGRTGILCRARTWEAYHGLSAGGFLTVKDAVPLLDPLEVEAFLDDVGPSRPQVIIVDTLARNFGGGDENSTKDMNLFIQHVDRLRTKLGCAVLVVHHSGHGSERERGSSALRGAADTMLKLTKTDGQRLRLTCDKQKDGEESLDVALRLAVVPSPDPLVRSCVLVEDTGASPGAPRLSATAATVLQAFPQTTRVTSSAWMAATGVPERTFYAVAKRLKQEDLVEQPTPGCYRLTPKGQALRAPVPDAEGPREDTAATAPPLQGEQCSSDEPNPEGAA